MNGFRRTHHNYPSQVIGRKRKGGVLDAASNREKQTFRLIARGKSRNET